MSINKTFLKERHRLLAAGRVFPWILIFIFLSLNRLPYLVSMMMYNRTMVSLGELVLSSNSDLNSIHLEPRQIDPLVHEFDKLQNKVINNDYLIYHISQLEYWTGDFDKTISLLQTSGSKEPLLMWLLGFAFWNSGGEILAKMIWDSVPDIDRYFLNRANLAEVRKDYIFAEKYYEIAKRLKISQASGEAGYWFSHSMNLLAEDIIESSELNAIIDKAIKLNSDSSSRQLELGIALYNSKEFDLAKDALIHAAELESTSFWPQYYLGRVYYGMHEFDQAETKLRDTLEIAPDFGRGYHWLARTLVEQGDYDQALFYYAKAVELIPEDPKLEGEYQSFIKQLNKP